MNGLNDGYVCHFLLIVDLRGVATAPNAGSPAYIVLIENVNIVCPRLIVWMIVCQASAFLYLLLISVHINAYPLLIQISSAESPSTDHPSTGSSSFTSNT